MNLNPAIETWAELVVNDWEELEQQFKRILRKFYLFSESSLIESLVQEPYDQSSNKDRRINLNHY